MADIYFIMRNSVSPEIRWTLDLIGWDVCHCWSRCAAYLRAGHWLNSQFHENKIFAVPDITAERGMV